VSTAPSTAAPALKDSLREALGATICWLVAEWLGLDLAYQSVITLHMVNNQVTTSVFQRGVERFVGRALGIGIALLIVTLFHNTPLLGVAFTVLALMVFFYINFAGWWAYTFLMGGLYIGAIVEVGHTDPPAAFTTGRAVLANILLGVVVADLVNWLLGFERSLQLQPGTNPLFPLRADWLSHAALVAVTTVLTQGAIRLIGWTGSQALITVMVLAVMADRRAILHKGIQRLQGAALGAAWGFATSVLVWRVQHLPVLLGLFAFGMFVAGYLARVSKTYSYVGVQMGFVIALILVAPPAEAGSLTPAIQRIEGVIVGLALSVFVASVWPGFPAAPVTTGSPATTGSGAAPPSRG
jgi:uncharacterized membrane protein YccC